MITLDQINQLAKLRQTNQTVILREYLQLWLLSQLYLIKGSEHIFFKGGTAVHLLLGSFRFSEDLDFTVNLTPAKFLSIFNQVANKINRFDGLTVREKRVITGKSYLLTYTGSQVPFKVFVRLDFSFREKPLKPAKSPLATDFPVVFTGFIYHLAAPEILAEKVRAALTRAKGRDIFDLWFLLNRQTAFDPKLISQKLKYYRQVFDRQKLITRLNSFPKKAFVQDLKPFVPLGQRERLPELFEYIKDFISAKLKTG